MNYRKPVLFLMQLKTAFLEFRRNDPLRMASSTAFFTIFALPPILIILINIMGMIFREEIISGEVFEKLTSFFGRESSATIKDILENLTEMGNNVLITVIGTIFFMFVSTTLFVVMQNSLNQLWNVKIKKGRHFILDMKQRGISLIIIFVSGLLFLLTLILEAALTILSDYIQNYNPNLNAMFLRVSNQLISVLIVSMWFAIMFKFLPFVHLSWRIVRLGALITGILFTIGKILLGFFLVDSNLGIIYGTSGSIVLLLLFVFYAAIIFYFGATFTVIRSRHFPVTIKHFATRYRIIEEEDYLAL